MKKIHAVKPCEIYSLQKLKGNRILSMYSLPLTSDLFAGILLSLHDARRLPKQNNTYAQAKIFAKHMNAERQA